MTLIDTDPIFRGPGCDCCACCDSYCADSERDAGPAYVLYRTDIAGDTYLGTAKILIRRDLQRPFPLHISDQIMDVTMPSQSILTAPDVKPPVSEHAYNADFLDRILAAGFTLHGGPDATHIDLYVGDTHAGFCMWADHPSSVTADELPRVRKVAQELGLNSLYKAALALRAVQATAA